MRGVKALTVDRSNSLPPWVQIKDQLKLAYSLGRLKEGDVLPSIRALAEQLGIGEAIVRRAYQELTQSGFLSAEPRKHLMVTDSLAKPEHVEALAQKCSVECDTIVQWARENGVSPISLARLLQRRAIEEENERPSYVYVDLSRPSAEKFAEQISRTWEVPVAAKTIDEMAALTDDELSSYAGILVNYIRHERLLIAIDGRASAVFPVRMKMHPRIARKLQRQPAGSKVLLVLPVLDAALVQEATLSYIAKELGAKVTIDAMTIADIPDLAAEAESGNYRLIIVSRHIWADIPERARRQPNVIAHENAMVMESLERARIAAGVLV